MSTPYSNDSSSNSRFLQTPPFHYARKFAQENDCDLAALNGEGIGNILVFSRLVEEYALSLGRPIKLLTAPINPLVGVVSNEDQYPIWKHNPFISQIVNADLVDEKIMDLINLEQDNFCQFNHMIENICLCYGLRPRKLKPSVFLSAEEMQWALEITSKLARPLICIHPSGKSSVLEKNEWFANNWQRLIEKYSSVASFVEISKIDYDRKNLSAFSKATTLRQAMSLIWASDMFIGFDSAPAHIATAFDKPAFVIWNVLRKNDLEEPFQEGFGPSAITRWAYPQNTNVMLLGEKGNEVLDLASEFILTNINKLYRRNHKANRLDTLLNQV